MMFKRLYDAIENGIADVSDPGASRTVVDELMAIRDQARADAERAEGTLESARAEHRAAGAEDLRQTGPQGHADRERRLPSRSPARTRPARRSGRERSSHHGSQERALAHTRRRVERKNSSFWSAQFCMPFLRQG